MGKIFTLTDDIKAIARDAIDDLINELGKVCRLYYPPRQVPCVNCTVDPIGGKSSGHWLDGGPTPFPAGSLCPMCNGDFTRSEQSVEEIKFLCAWHPKDFFIPGPRGFTAPAGRMQTKGFMTDVPKVLQAVEMVAEVPLEQYIQARFKRVDNPVDQSNIIQGRYFVCNWDRTG